MCVADSNVPISLITCWLFCALINIRISSSAKSFTTSLSLNTDSFLITLSTTLSFFSGAICLAPLILAKYTLEVRPSPISYCTSKSDRVGPGEDERACALRARSHGCVYQACLDSNDLTNGFLPTVGRGATVSEGSPPLASFFVGGHPMAGVCAGDDWPNSLRWSCEGKDLEAHSASPPYASFFKVGHRLGMLCGGVVRSQTMLAAVPSLVGIDRRLRSTAVEVVARPEL
mmetsp:Transcript_5406/g.10193  ORF Transcript_5406/g.10193 Transcript_5406/m.10193 type:complete len:230 (+) Transcript_5406:32-721(+)